MDLPERALGDIQISSEYVVYAVKRLAAETGLKVSVVGHSEGGLEPRWAIKWWPEVRAAVEDLVTLATPHHGTAVTSAYCASGACTPAAWQMRPGSRFLEALNGGDETPGEISYTSVYTLTDELVQPQVPESTSRLEGAANLAVQDLCPGRPVDHIGMVWDGVVFEAVKDALTHPGPANPGRLPPDLCTRTLMPGVEPTEDAATYLKAASNLILAYATGRTVPEEPALAGYAQLEPSPTPRTGEAAGTPREEERLEQGRRATLPATGAPPGWGSFLLLLASGLLLRTVRR